MDRFENMQAFVRVVEAGSISGAADRMEVAKSVISRRLRELEAHLGAELFHRTTRQMNLTDTGRAFYQQSVRILADVLEADVTLSGAAREAAGLADSSFDFVISNPPFNAPADRQAKGALKRKAHVLEPGALGQWVLLQRYPIDDRLDR